MAGHRHYPVVQGEGAAQDFALLEGGGLASRDKETPRRPLVRYSEPDDLIAVGEWERIQQCRIDDAEQPCSGGNPVCEGDDSRRGEAGPAAEDAQRISEDLRR